MKLLRICIDNEINSTLKILKPERIVWTLLKSHLFLDQIQQIILHQVHQRRNDDIGIA